MRNFRMLAWAFLRGARLRIAFTDSIFHSSSSSTVIFARREHVIRSTMGNARLSVGASIVCLC